MEIIKKYRYVILIALCFIVYFQSLFFGFVRLDDNIIVFEQWDKIGNFNNFSYNLLSGYMDGNYYRPMINLSFFIDAQLGGQNPFIYHFSNLLLHSIATVIIFVLFKKLNYNFSISFLASSIFAVHPLLNNSVLWIVGRNDIIATIFSILSFIFFIKYLEKNNILNISLHLLFFFLSVFSKENVVLLPVVIIIYKIFITKAKKWQKNDFIIIAGWLLTISLMAYMRSYLGMNDSKGNAELGIFAIIANIQTIPDVLFKFVLPIKINPLPSFSLYPTLFGSIFLLSSILYIFLKKDFDNRKAIFGFLWFIIFIFPSLFIRLNISDIGYDYLPCRIYLPFIGILIFTLEIIPKKYLDLKIKKVAIISLTIVLIFSVLNIVQSRYYKTPIKFWVHAVRNQPDKAYYHANLGKLLIEINKLDLSIKELEKAVELHQKDASFFSDLGKAYFDTGNISKAVENLKKAYQINPNLYSEGRVPKLEVIYKIWAEDFAKKKDYNNAVIAIDQALDFNNYDSDSYTMKSSYFISLKKYEDALESAKTALSINPSNLYAINNIINIYAGFEKNLDSAAKYIRLYKSFGGKFDPENEEYFNSISK